MRTRGALLGQTETTAPPVTEFCLSAGWERKTVLDLPLPSSLCQLVGLVMSLFSCTRVCVRVREMGEENGCVVVVACALVTLGCRVWKAAGKDRAGVYGKVSLSPRGAASPLTLDCRRWSDKCFG